MMRALWSAASGMIAQQTNVDTISNNIANVNTTGYKTEKTEFKSLLYQNLQARTDTGTGRLRYACCIQYFHVYTGSNVSK